MVAVARGPQSGPLGATRSASAGRAQAQESPRAAGVQAGRRTRRRQRALMAVGAEEEFWVYPSAKVGEIEDFGEDAFAPFLRRPALVNEWAQLLEHARRLDACRETGRAWGYTC